MAIMKKQVNDAQFDFRKVWGIIDDVIDSKQSWDENRLIFI